MKDKKTHWLLETNITEDPFTNSINALGRLVNDYYKHGSIVVAVDFDNTLFDLHKRGYTFPKVIELIKKCNQYNLKVVIFSGSAKERHQQIQQHCDDIGIKIDGINCDVVDWRSNKELDWSQSKIFYSILLDDRAGLKSACNLLQTFILYIENHN